MKYKIEKWAVNTLYLNSFFRYGRINKKQRKIIFNEFGFQIFRMFPSFKVMLAIRILIKYYKYKTYQKQLNLWYPFPKEISHTWGEIQDIIRAYNSIPTIKLSST